MSDNKYSIENVRRMFSESSAMRFPECFPGEYSLIFGVWWDKRFIACNSWTAGFKKTYSVKTWQYNDIQC